jgi:alpha-beta hydrolase superfamily lysophospholipase
LGGVPTVFKRPRHGRARLSFFAKRGHKDACVSSKRPIIPPRPAPSSPWPAPVDGAALRVALWRPAAEPIGTLAIFPGRAEFIEKYFETVAEALARGFVVTVIDWRGQGLSTRQVANRRKGHIDDFSVFERDIDALVRPGRSSPSAPGHGLRSAIPWAAPFC